MLMHLYRKSLRVAARSPEEVDTSFRYEGRWWYCAAKNPHREVNGQRLWSVVRP